MTKEEQLGLAIRIAVEAHADQYDKGGQPYILHPLHVMNQLMYDTQLATAAVLHDVIEDSNITIDDLIQRGFSNRVVTAVECLTHIPGESYDDYITRICGNYDAIRIKQKDLEHNSNITRLKNKYGMTDKDHKRMDKYFNAFIKLTEAKRIFER